MAPFTRDGLPFKQLVAQGLLTPSYTLASLSIEASVRALELLAELSSQGEKQIHTVNKCVGTGFQTCPQRPDLKVRPYITLSLRAESLCHSEPKP